MIHAYSLVHDDLPAMDDDDLRRGKASLHIKFGEDIAILTGDALLNEASSLLFDLSIKNSSYIRASKYVFEHTGYKGMVEGQVLDLRRDKIYDKSYLLNVYDKKTADLFKASIVSAGLVCNLTDEKLDKLCDYAYNLGLAYQIQDDLLEDNYKDELNILNIMNEEKSRELLYKINFSAKDTIKEFTDSDLDHGVNATQATISRDIKELRISKVQADDYEYKYTVVDTVYDTLNERMEKIFKESVLSVEKSAQLCVIKTISYCATVCGQYITNSKLENIGGIVTGIDTIFITPKDFEKLDELIENIRGMVR